MSLHHHGSVRKYKPYPMPTETSEAIAAAAQHTSASPDLQLWRAGPTDRGRHDRMVALVEAMLDLHRKLAAAVTDQEKTVLQRQIVATDRQSSLTGWCMSCTG